MPDRHGPYRDHRFLLEINEVAQVGFSQATIPETSTEVISYRNGDEAPTPRKLSGLHSYGDLTLQNGVTDSSLELFEWRQMVEQGKVDAARQTVAVIVLDEEGNPGPRYEFTDAWPSQYDAPDLDGSGTNVAIESLTISHEGMERVA